MKVGRNDPCPCGSGKKYKKCHLGEDERAGGGAAPAAPISPAARWHALDERLVRRLLAYADERWKGGLAEGIEEVWGTVDETQLSIVIPWAVYHLRLGDTPIARQLLEAEGTRLTDTEKEWLATQLGTPLSVWEATEVRPGEGMMMTDLLTHESCFVTEASASMTLEPRLAILGRVSPAGDFSLLVGCHPRSLSPTYAAEVVRVVRRELGIRTRKVPAQRLLESPADEVLIWAWQDGVDAMYSQPPPTLQNADGDPLVFLVDRYDVTPGELEAVKKALGGLRGAEGPHQEEDDGPWVVNLSKKGEDLERILVGRVEVTDTRMRLDTNSVRRANALRRRVERACGNLIVRRGREKKDMSDLLEEHLENGEALEGSGDGAGPVSPEEAEFLRSYVEEHYRRWVDMEIPALGGRTPREASRTAGGRRKLDVLLREMEYTESRKPEAERFDFGVLRRKLGV